jgi:Tfp pilus assembly protein PilV
MQKLARARRHGASEQGFALMEVVISAAVLVVVVLGALAAIDAVTATAGANKARTVAATLAEKDQESLRGLRTVELSDLKKLIPAPRTVKVNGIDYTITSDAQWVTDAKGDSISCALTNGDGSFLRITSTVSSKTAGVKPVVISSIVAPQPGSGTLTVVVKDLAGKPVTPVTVEAKGPVSTLTHDTDANGCAIFGSVDSGAYEIALDKAGYIGTNGLQRTTKNANVAAGSLTIVEMLYEKKASATVKVDTIIPPATTPVADESTGVTVAQNGLQAGFLTFPATYGALPPYPSSYTFDLFPFTTPYKVYSGRCTYADPTRYGVPAVSLATTPGVNAGTFTVREPATNLLIKRVSGTGSTVLADAAYIYAYPTGADCDEQIVLGPTDTTGKVAKPGLPFGDYQFCAERTSSGTTRHITDTTIVPNKTPTGTTTTKTLTIPNTTAAIGPCADPTPPVADDGS